MFAHPKTTQLWSSGVTETSILNPPFPSPSHSPPLTPSTPLSPSHSSASFSTCSCSSVLTMSLWLGFGEPLVDASCIRHRLKKVANHNYKYFFYDLLIHLSNFIMTIYNDIINSKLSIFSVFYSPLSAKVQLLVV